MCGNVQDISWTGLGAAYVSALWTYSGWQGISHMTEELKSPENDMAYIIIGAMLTVMGIYFTLNIAYLSILTTEEV